MLPYFRDEKHFLASDSKCFQDTLYTGCPKKTLLSKMGEVRIFWNTPSCPMNKINRDRHLLDSKKLIWRVLPPIGHYTIKKKNIFYWWWLLLKAIVIISLWFFFVCVCNSTLASQRVKIIKIKIRKFVFLPPLFPLSDSLASHFYKSVWPSHWSD